MSNFKERFNKTTLTINLSSVLSVQLCGVCVHTWGSCPPSEPESGCWRGFPQDSSHKSAPPRQTSPSAGTPAEITKTHPHIRVLAENIGEDWKKKNTHSLFLGLSEVRFIFFGIPTRNCESHVKKWQTLAKQKAVRGMMPYWATTAMPTPLGFTMWAWKNTTHQNLVGIRPWHTLNIIKFSLWGHIIQFVCVK